MVLFTNNKPLRKMSASRVILFLHGNFMAKH